MNRRSILVALVGGLVVGGICGLLVVPGPLRYLFIFDPSEECVAVVVPVENIKANTRINQPEDYFALRMVRRKNLPETPITDLDRLRNRVAAHLLKAGKAVVKEDFGARLRIINDLPQGRRAVSITLRAGSWEPPPGTWVDLVYVQNDPDTGPTGKLMVENALVLAVGGLSQTEFTLAPRTVTLAVSPKGAEHIIGLIEKGTFVLAARPEASPQP